MPNANPPDVDALFKEAKASPSAQSYGVFLGQHFSWYSQTVPERVIQRVLKELDFAQPPIDLRVWYGRWLHYVENNPVDYVMNFKSKDLAWLLCTLGRAVGYSKVAFFTGKNERISKQGKVPEPIQFGKLWLDGAKNLSRVYPAQIAVMCSLLVLPDMVLKNSGNTVHRRWVGECAEDMSAHVIRTIFDDTNNSVIEVILDLHDTHAARCEALRDVFTPKTPHNIELPPLSA